MCLEDTDLIPSHRGQQTLVDGLEELDCTVVRIEGDVRIRLVLAVGEWVGIAIGVRGGGWGEDTGGWLGESLSVVQGAEPGPGLEKASDSITPCG